jgi:hypothetical protein
MEGARNRIIRAYIGFTAAGSPLTAPDSSSKSPFRTAGQAGLTLDQLGLFF